MSRKKIPKFSDTAPSLAPATAPTPPPPNPSPPRRLRRLDFPPLRNPRYAHVVSSLVLLIMLHAESEREREREFISQMNKQTKQIQISTVAGYQ